MANFPLIKNFQQSWESKDFRPIIPFSIVVGVLILSAIFAAFVGETRQPAQLLRNPLFLLLPGIAAFVFFTRWPQLGLAILMFSNLLIPFAIGTGSNTNISITVLLVMLLTGLWIFKMLADDRQITIVPSRTILPLLVFSIVVLLSFGVGQFNWFFFAEKAPLTAQLGGVAIFLLSFFAFILVSNQVKDIRWLKILTHLFLVLSGFYILTQVIPGYGRLGRNLFESGAYSGSIFWVWIIALAFSQGIYNKQLKLVWRIILLALVVATYAVSFGRFSDWTSGWLPSLIALGVIFFIGSPKWGIAFAIIAGIAGLVKMQSVNELLLSGGNSYSLMTRLEAWKIVLEIIKVNPLLGLGPANYYWYTPLYPILGYAVQFNSHNNYVDILAQTGILGLVCFIWFVGEVGWLGWKLRERIPDGGFAKAYVYGALGGLAGTVAAGMLGDWFLPFVYNVGLRGFRASVFSWLFLGGLVVLERLYSANQAEVS